MENPRNHKDDIGNHKENLRNHKDDIGNHKENLRNHKDSRKWFKTVRMQWTKYTGNPYRGRTAFYI
jgi:hypothetical protein